MGSELETTLAAARTETVGRLQGLESPAWWSVQEEASVSGLLAAGPQVPTGPFVARSLPCLPQDRGSPLSLGRMGEGYLPRGQSRVGDFPEPKRSSCVSRSHSEGGGSVLGKEPRASWRSKSLILESDRSGFKSWF